jgi:tRNA-guanine family transglycosylase
LPLDRPRYLMGVGTPDDILEAVARGVDMFDCVMPTRNGRHGMAFTRFGQINLRNARHADDPRPLDEESSWPSTRQYARAYLHHLVKSGDAGRDAAVGNQHRLLPAPDARHQGGDFNGNVREFLRTHARRMGEGRHRPAQLTLTKLSAETSMLRADARELYGAP